MNNTLVAIIIGIITIFVGYNFYARRIDREVIAANPKKATLSVGRGLQLECGRCESDLQRGKSYLNGGAVNFEL